MDNKEDDLKEKEKKIFSSVLTDEEKDKLKNQALKELDEENKKKISQEYKDTVKAEAKRKALFKDAKSGENENGLVPIFVDLPKVAECIRLDGVAYYPGRTYNVLPQVREVILDIMHRGKMHEDEVSGRKDSNQFRTRNPLMAK